MLRIILYTAIFIISFQNVNAKGFKSLSNEKPVVCENDIDNALTLEEKILSHVILSITTNKKDTTLFLKLDYVIGFDTITDYIKVNRTYKDTVKKLIINPGKKLKVLVSLNNKHITETSNLKGKIEIHNHVLPTQSPNYNEHVFTGTVWEAKELPLFKFTKDDEDLYKMKFYFYLSENYLYDKLFLKFKFITPDQGIVELEKEIKISDKEFHKFTKRKVTIPINEISVGQSGYYYIQLKHQMASTLVNGIEMINYKLVKAKNTN